MSASTTRTRRLLLEQSSSSKSSRNSSGSSTDSDSDPTQIASNISSGNKKQPNVGGIIEKSQIIPNQLSDKSTHASENQPNEGDQQQVNTARSTVQMIEIPMLPNQSTGETSKSKEKQPNDEGKTEKSPNPKTKVKLFICKKFDHNITSNLDKMDDSRYCKPGKRFDKAFCQGCKDKRRSFVVKKVDPNDDDIIQPCPRTPIYCCLNWKAHCQYALCNSCYHAKYELQVQRGGRRK